MHSGTALATRSAASLDMQLPTATQSSALVRRLVEAGISSILYLRGLFDERCYTEESVGGLTVKHLKKKSSADTHSRTATDAKATRQLDQAATIASWIESACGEPISKKYLRSLTVGISVTPHTPWLIVECYTFHIRYSGSTATAAKTGPPAAHSRSEVKAITQQLLRRLLVLTQSLPPLPSGRVLSMKLSYYPHTPADYEPPQFCA
ncbi:DNA-binding protein, partial [Ramicandelaber brevisporus]